MKSTVGGFYELYIFQPFSLSVFVLADTTKLFYVEEKVIKGLLQKSLLYIILVKYHCNKFQGIFKILSLYCNFKMFQNNTNTQAHSIIANTHKLI